MDMPALAAYAVLPSVLTGVSISVRTGSAAGAAAGILLGALQIGLLLLLSGARRSRTAVGCMLLYAGLTIGAGFSLGELIDGAFADMLHRYCPGTFLAAVFFLVSRFISRISYKQTALSFNRMILLLFSYAALKLLLSAVKDLDYFSVLEALYLLPSLLFLFRLRNKPKACLVISGSRLHFRNQDILTGLSRMQSFIMLSLLTAADGRIRCSDVIGGYEETGWTSGVDCNSGECKASLCGGYMSVYRNISDLKLRLNQLGIGDIVSPSNKRNIKEEGWRLVLYPGVELVNRRGLAPEKEQLLGFLDSTGSIAADMPEVPEEPRPEPKKEPSPKNISAVSVLLSIVNVSFVALELSALGEASAATLLFPLFMLLSLTLPFLFTDLNKRLALLLPGTFISLILLFISAGTDESLTLFLALKCITLYLSAYLIHRKNPEYGREQSNERFSRIIFWLIWYYMTGILVFRNNPAAFGDTNYYFSLHDHLMYILLFFQSVFFLSKQIGVLKINGNTISYNGSELNKELTQQNIALLRLLLKQQRGAPGEPLRCSTIAGLIYPEEAENCRMLCKPSVCPVYQKIYKRLRVIRKCLRTHGIGTIQSPDKRPGSGFDGWRIIIDREVKTEWAEDIELRPRR